MSRVSHTGAKLAKFHAVVLAVKDVSGAYVPVDLGQGKFAKVLRARQESAGHHGRPVAIKILHDFATNDHERLFHQEIELLKGMNVEFGVNVVSTLDVLPMAMCGCGNIYHPLCPNGCGEEIVRDEEPKKDENHPALRCPKCSYRLSGRFVSEEFWELLQPPAKRCCTQGVNEKTGTILNFVDRSAIVMELLEQKLPDFLEQRRNKLQELMAGYGAGPSAPARQAKGWWRRALAKLATLWRYDRADVLVSKAILLEKVRLMVELAEAVDWLHEEKRIVHKDLAPDNVMVTSIGAPGGDWVSLVGARDADPKGERARSFHDALSSVVSSPRFHLCVIDFGLSDKDKLTRSWYEEEMGSSNIKQPFLSPEARFIRQRIGQQLQFEDGRFRVPQDLVSKLLVTDIIADTRDPNHNHDVTITRLETSPSGETIAYFEGTPPPNPKNQQFELVYRPGEAHDLYSVGALYYYILTEQQDEVEKLGGFISSMPDGGLDLDVRTLTRDDRYMTRRNAIREKFWQDELMVLILSAMVRGQRGSLKESRIDRSPRATRDLLERTKQIYHSIQREILAAPELGRLYRAMITACVALCVGLLVILPLTLLVTVLMGHPRR
jgi:serine/threonine protein kinase